MTMHSTLRSTWTRTSIAFALAALIAASPLSSAAPAAKPKAAPAAAGPKVEPPDAPMPLANARSPFVGEPFFLLSDATYGSTDNATVRLELNQPASLEQVGGIDVVVYRVPDPLAFLQKQKNLHRVQIDAKAADDGLSNVLTHLWDSWVVKARIAWRRLFSSDARKAVVEHAPDLGAGADLTKPSTFEEPARFKPIAGLTVVDRFRYPLQVAKPIAPPKDLKLEGSSSEFVASSPGNVYVPLGKRAPGLYVVEAISGQHRATTLLFVSDTVALTKVSGDQMLVFAAKRADGAPVPKTRVVWTDGVGVLKSGDADAQGLVRLDRKAPEQTYVFGLDPTGGVFISENFYYDSEIYAAKVYTVTDRPLYRPGDVVQVKVSGREFRGARDSVALKDAEIAMTVYDPSGGLVGSQSLHLNGAHGGDTQFTLPENAVAGGYELRLAMGDDVYTAAFRVADYQKPHFEILVQPDKADLALNEAVNGKIQLNYPDGKPVAHAHVVLTARAQKLTMVDGELDYAGQFPLKLTQSELNTDARGVARFSLPAATEPSRYVLTALATDGAAYRVRTSKEILVERGSASYKLSTDRQFSKPGETVTFNFTPSQRNASVTDAAPASQWEWIRLENRARQTGALSAGNSVAVSFPQPGTYTLNLRDARGRIVGAATHWVSGEGIKAPTGSISIVFNRASYRAGDTAEALVSFPEPVDNALLTLERERVEGTALLGQSADWVRSERLSPTQWKLSIAVRETMSPNMTVSVAYLKHGDYVFQNQGLMVEQPRIALSFKADKAVYAPGETVTVDVNTTLAGKPVAADVTVGVVDEMIYVLQPEIAPTIDDFFYHPRRDNVRTSASLSFIGYDLATNKLGTLPAARQVNERAIKVLERPRRDNIDTAAWMPRLATDASGHARFTFKMPESLTRWRITGRAIEAGGAVGQRVDWVRSDKNFYAKWTSPDWQRMGDQSQAALALFNQTDKPAKVEWEAKGEGIAKRETVTLQPGANFVSLPIAGDKRGSADVTVTLRQDGKVVDQMATPVKRVPVAWRAPVERALELGAGSVALALPADATQVRVSFAQDPAAGEFNRWMDDLIEYPYGCVEQTASRMLPLSIALQTLSPAQQGLAPALTQRLASARLSLVQMAGPQARFGWWGRDMSDDAFLTAYAYYADWRATQALHLTLPAEHWQTLLDVYAKEGVKLPSVQRALMLSWMQEMRLPVGSLAAALANELGGHKVAELKGLPKRRASFAMVEEDSTDARDVALVLAVHTADAAKAKLGAEPRAAADAAAKRLTAIKSPMVQALLMLTHRVGIDQAGAVLKQVRTDAPTMDRALALTWLYTAYGRAPEAGTDHIALPAPWQRVTGPGGKTVWQWPAGVALPANLALPAGAKAAWAYLSYESAETGNVKLNATVERTLWRVIVLAPKDKPDADPNAEADKGRTPREPVAARSRIKLEPVTPGTPLDSNALYLDQIEVTAGDPLRWAIVEVGLPPGAAVESGTWGLDIGEAEGEATPLERAQHVPNPQGYAVPVQGVEAGKSVVLRHLVRFSQRGQFKLPPTRVYRMYQSEAKAIDPSNDWLKLQVR